MGTVPISRERRGLPVGADQPRRTNVPIITEFRNVPIFQYANVRVTGVGGRLEVTTSSGGVEASDVKGLSGEALTARHDAETTYADIDFRWPEGRGLAYRLESSYGHLDCDFPGTLKERGSRYTLEGSTGEGGASVSLISKSGSVRLRGE